MTEKIARRGIKTPDSFEPHLLEKTTVGEIIHGNGLVLSEENQIGEVREWLKHETEYHDNYFIIVSNENIFRGIVSSSNLFSHQHNIHNNIGSLIRRKAVSIEMNNSLRSAVEIMIRENVDVLPVVSNEQMIMGVLTHKDILNAYKLDMGKDHKMSHLSIKRGTLKMLIKGHKLVTAVRGKTN